MKTFKHYLIENNNSEVLKSTEVIPFILKNCQQWFREIWGKEIKNEDDFFVLLDSGYSLYRGIPVYYDGLINVAKTNRKPVSTNKIIHNVINKALTKLGFTTNRGNSLFCTNSIRQSRSYGVPYYVFPMDGYEYLYSPKIFDLFMLFSIPSNFLYFSDKRNPKEMIFPNLSLYIDPDDIDMGETETEFFEKFSKYSQEELETIFEIDVNVFQNIFNFQNKNIKEYIFKPHREMEIMVRPKAVLLNYKYSQIEIGDD